MKKIVLTSDAPVPIGPYSQAVIMGNLVFTAGQIAINPETEELEIQDVKVQTERVIKNLQAVLKKAGCDLISVLKTTVFLKNMDDFVLMNEIYGRYFGGKPPARSVVEVSRLPKDVLVEIDCIAYIGNNL